MTTGRRPVEHVVDYYAQFDLDRDATSAEIRATLDVVLVRNRAKTTCPSNDVASVRRQIALLEHALEVFADDGAKERYDRDLHQGTIASVDRAMPRATAVDQAELHWRKGLALYALGHLPEARKAALDGLRQGRGALEHVRHGLENVYVDSLQAQARLPAVKARPLYRDARNDVMAADMPEMSRRVLLMTLNENLDRLDRFLRLADQKRRLQAVDKPSGGEPDVAAKAIGLGAISFVGMTGTLSSVPCVGALLLPITVATAVYVGYRMRERSTYLEAVARYAEAQHKLREVDRRLDDRSLVTVVRIRR